METQEDLKIGTKMNTEKIKKLPFHYTIPGRAISGYPLRCHHVTIYWYETKEQQDMTLKEFRQLLKKYEC